MKSSAKVSAPPDSNRGVQNRSVSLSLDWIEGTFPQNTKVKLPDELSQEYEECYPFHGYTEGSKFSDGRIVLTNPSRPDMGTHIIWGGESLKKINISASGLVQSLSGVHFRFTRLDFAVDIRGWKLKPHHATNRIKRREIITRAKKCPHQDDPMFGGETQYVGTKASSLFLRIYDKAAQMGVDEDWTRAELVAQGRRAQAASFAVIRGEDYRALVMGFVRFPTWAKWNKVMATNAVTIPYEKKPSATEKWLLKQCAPALAHVLEDHEDDAFWFQFIEAVRQRRTEIASTRAGKSASLDTV